LPAVALAKAGLRRRSFDWQASLRGSAAARERRLPAVARRRGRRALIAVTVFIAALAAALALIGAGHVLLAVALAVVLILLGCAAMIVRLMRDAAKAPEFRE